VPPTGGVLTVVRFAQRRWRRGLREARFPPGVGGKSGATTPLGVGARRPWRAAAAAATTEYFRRRGAGARRRRCNSLGRLRRRRRINCGSKRRASYPTGTGRRPLLPPPWAGDVGIPHLESSRRRLRMPLASTSAPRRGLPPWATRTSAAAPSSAGFQISCFSRRCALCGLRRVARTPQSQNGGMQYYAWGFILVAVGAGAREQGDRWCVAFVACRCGL